MTLHSDVEYFSFVMWPDKRLLSHDREEHGFGLEGEQKYCSTVEQCIHAVPFNKLIKPSKMYSQLRNQIRSRAGGGDVMQAFGIEYILSTLPSRSMPSRK
jgi:hypothetical protein